MNQETSLSPDEWIERSIRDTRIEQREAEVFNEDHQSNRDSHKQLVEWSVSDVTEWLEKKELHKFVLLFQRHRVCGQDLAELKLPFLDNFNHVTLEEREVLLSEIYNLLNPQTVCASEEDLTKIKSPVEKKKYFAALQAAQDKSTNMTRASSVLVLPTHYSSIKLSSNQLSPKGRPRYKSESGSDLRSSDIGVRRLQTDTKKRKVIPKVESEESIFHHLKNYGGQSLFCVELTENQVKDVVFASDGQNCVTVDSVPSPLMYLIHKGDRVIEVNGYLLQPSKKDFNNKLLNILNSKIPAQIVLCSRPPGDKTAMFEDEKWNKLHSLLVEMRDSDLPNDVPLPHPLESSSQSPTQAESFRNSTFIQEQNKKLEEKVIQQQKEIERLQLEVEDKEARMHDLELSRDKAIEKLKETRGKVRLKNSKESVGGHEYYNMTMDTLSVEDSSREQIVESLKDIVKEASKQKWYLDRLISLVIEESPWLLDEVDSSLDNIPLTNQSEEEFC